MVLHHVHHAPDAEAPSVSERELRTAPRVRCEGSIELEMDGKSVNCRLVDMSTTGAAMLYDGTIELGEVVQVRFPLPGKEGEALVCCAGLVRGFRADPLGNVIGLEFHNLGANDRKRLAEQIRWVQSGGEIADARDHWSHKPDPGAASVVPSSLDPNRKVLRWVPGFGSLFSEIASHLIDNDNVFVPVIDPGLYEGEILYLEIVPPQAHVVFRSLVEVTWVQEGRDPGVGLRLPALTPFDLDFLRSARDQAGQPMRMAENPPN
ncbi:MAG: PilZ domain-containing protein [Myxococcota bacterium]|nr:PilZ domain-containing protein [Myxococcota bacterium]